MMKKTTMSTTWRMALGGLLLMFGASAAAEKNPYAKPDDSWISLKGTVENVTADSFTLDYGKGIITVEMDDGDRDGDAYKLLKGDKVTVAGLIDDDFFEMKKIEAGSVHVHKLDTTFYASAMDEEDNVVTVISAVDVPATLVQGTVTDVDAQKDEFTLGVGDRKFTVEVDTMPYDPLDDEGYQKISEGDRVSVTAYMYYDLLTGRTLAANSIVTLFDSDS